MTFNEYASSLEKAIGVTFPPAYGPDTGLFDEIDLDSLSAFELILFTEDLAGLTVPPAEPPSLATLGDAFSYYLAASRLAAGAD
jgi:hypothetical protein